MKKQLLIVATLDTKGIQVDYIKNCVHRHGIQPLIMDVGTLGEPLTPPDITRFEVAEAGGYKLEDIIKKKNRSVAVKAVQEGGAILARRLLGQGRLHGVFGMGGGTGTAIVTYIMQSLPFGLPKVVLSTVASRDVKEYIGTKDIVMIHSVADIIGLNEFLRLILEQAIFAICGMITHGGIIKKEKPMVAVTAYGINSICAMNAEPLLREKGYEMIAFHANGCGGMAMEEFISEGLVAGVIDFTLHEIADEMYGGYCKGIGPQRLETAGRKGIPIVVVPGGLDNAVFSPFYPMPDQLKGRKIHYHDTRFCVRMGAKEMKEFAQLIGAKLNKSNGPICLLIPKRGWSEVDKPGMEFYEPEINQIFIEEIRKVLNPKVWIEEIDLHISDPGFAQKAVTILDDMIRGQR